MLINHSPMVVRPTASRALGYLKKLLPDVDNIDWETPLDELSEEWGWDI